MTNASRAVLVVEDEPQLRRVLRTLLELANFRVVEADSAERGLLEARTHKPDLLIVDLGLPDRDGIEVITGVRSWSPVPIIVLSARSAESDKVAALEAGADDYITKPFNMDELLARVRAVSRRAGDVSDIARVRVGGHTVDLARHLVMGPAGEVELTPIEWEILEVLVRNAGKLVSQSQLLTEAGGAAYLRDSNSLRVHMTHLRHKLEPDPARPRHLRTEPGMGYRFSA